MKISLNAYMALEDQVIEDGIDWEGMGVEAPENTTEDQVVELTPMMIDTNDIARINPATDRGQSYVCMKTGLVHRVQHRYEDLFEFFRALDFSKYEQLIHSPRQYQPTPIIISKPKRK